MTPPARLLRRVFRTSTACAVALALAAPARAAEERAGFSTRHAQFLPAEWGELPGWQQDDLADAWRAFVNSCAALARRPGWDAPCERSRDAGTGNDALRAFFEREFVLYEIRNTDSTPEGVITGYYEPLLAGSRTRQGAFTIPVHGTPADMLTLDVRLWPRALRGRPLPARLEGRKVIPMPEANAPYLLDVGDLAPDERDKKLRLRLDGQRLVPYYTRAEIQRDGLARAPVLAWVADAVGLYSMQIQGSGKLRLPDGRMLRLAYAEQNGQPFRPPVAATTGKTGRVRLTMRGLSIELPEGEADEAAAEPEPVTRGARPRSSAAVSDAEVERMIERLAGGRPEAPKAIAAAAAPAVAPAAPRARAAASAPGAAARRERAPAAVAGTPAPMVFAAPSAATLDAMAGDPSYVFFREIPDGPGGPIGALGVPLTPGRSVAVDPRITPLGFPVFLSTQNPADRSAFNRLVMAQDTGGAIRGAVRADYFWGFGADAYVRAVRMKENGRMWLLMPVAQQLALREQATVTRGAAGSAAASDCLIADADYCVEDR